MRLSIIGLVILISSCGFRSEVELPILGEHEYVERLVDGKTLIDTQYYEIPSFSLLNQDSLIVNKKLTQGKIYVADFFFTSCPTICPKMKRNMHDLYKIFETEEKVLFLSHSIDPKRDTVLKLRDYANRLEVTSSKWHFLTGDKNEIYALAKAYMVSADEDPRAPGGFVHSGAFILIDDEGRIRAYYDGTIQEDTKILENDIRKLLKSI